MRLPLIAMFAPFGSSETIAHVQARSGDGIASAVCAACHTTDCFVMNSRSLTSEAWNVEIAKMRAAFGAPLDDGLPR
jgi:hypothetical protein